MLGTAAAVTLWAASGGAELPTAALLVIEGIGIATVYRTLKKLVADGAIRVVTLPGDAARYEMNGSAHHHHFQCTRCRRVYEIAGCPGDLRHLAPPGFTVERHEITLYGRCAHCRPRAA